MRFSVVALVVVLTVCSGVGQSTFGGIVGVVHDTTQAVVPDASIKIRCLEDNSTRSTTSDQNGSFEFLNLKPGRYALSAQSEGFAEFQVPSAELTSRQTLRIDVTLGIKSQSQTVEVSDTVAVINTENAVISDSKDNSQITQLPLNNRATTTSPLAALSLSPNVQQDSSGNIALDGASSAMVNFSVDGISTANVRQNGALQDAYPSQEGISAVRVTSFNNRAEFSQVGDVTFTTERNQSVSRQPI
jgi:Carboxypeptidase regulatory-like domain